MTWSLGLHNGDLIVNGTSFAQVTGFPKLVQDLRCALLEKMGTDDMHPSFGSLIDGGTDAQGRWHPSVLGSPRWERVALEVESEIRRICSSYQDQQVTRTQQEQLTRGSSTLTPDELLISVTSVDMTQVQDTLMASVGIQTAGGQSTILTIPLSSQGMITS